jgi:hypothetical protein
MTNTEKNYRRSKRTQTGGTLLRGVQTHWSRKNPPVKRDRQRWRAEVARGDW